MADKQHSITKLPIYYSLLRLVKLQEQALAASQDEIINRYADVLYILLQPELHTQQSLAHLLAIDKVAMVRLIDQLEAIKLVKREPHPQDRRCHLLKPTSKAERLRVEIETAFGEMNKQLFEGFNKAEVKELYEQIRLMQEALIKWNKK